MPATPSIGAGQRGLEQPDGDRLGVGLAGLEVVAGQQAGRGADLQRLEQGVEAQVVDVGRG